MTTKSDELRLEYLPLDDLKTFPGNPKKHDDPLIDESIEEYGFTNPVLLYAKQNFIVGGNGRVERLERRRIDGKKPPKRIKVDDKGRWLVPCVRLPFKDIKQAQRYLLVDNQATIRGGWDGVKLTEMLVEFEEFDLHATGFSPEDVVQFVQKYGDSAPAPSFPQAGLDLKTDYCCPKCQYEWSGDPRAGKTLRQDDAEAVEG